MSTRREFLGLLAAAPVVAPAVAKEMAASQFANGGFVKGVAGVGKYETLTLSADTIVAGSITSDSVDIGGFTMKVDQFKIADTWVETYYRAVHGPDGSAQVVPNRLYGATINHEGEAI